MNTLTGEILTLPKMSGSVSTPKSLSGNVGAKTINIGGKGDDGATFTPSVSADGVISWTNDKELPNPEPVNIKGKDGASVTVKSVSESAADGGSNVVTFSDGKKVTIKNGNKGNPGEDGYTPIKNKDYFTEADKAEMVSAVISALPKYNGEVVAE